MLIYIYFLIYVNSIKWLKIISYLWINFKLKWPYYLWSKSSTKRAPDTPRYNKIKRICFISRLLKNELKLILGWPCLTKGFISLIRFTKGLKFFMLIGKMKFYIVARRVDFFYSWSFLPRLTVMVGISVNHGTDLAMNAKYYSAVLFPWLKDKNIFNIAVILEDSDWIMVQNGYFIA